MGKPAPRKMSRVTTAVAGESVVCFNVGGSREMYTYNVSSDTWALLPKCPYLQSSFVIVNDVLTAIGGWNSISMEHKKLVFIA